MPKVHSSPTHTDTRLKCWILWTTAFAVPVSSIPDIRVMENSFTQLQSNQKKIISLINVLHCLLNLNVRYLIAERHRVVTDIVRNCKQ
jgi:hypothetical protein